MPAFNLSPAQRADLRAQAHALKPVVMIGAEGLTDPVVAEAERAIDFHQLIKVRVFGDERQTRIDIADALCERLNAALVQHIGKLLVFWRPAKDATARATAGVQRAPRASGPSANAETARRVAATPAKSARGVAAKVPAAKKAPARRTARTTDFATAAPRERVKARDAGEGAAARPRTGKGAAPRMVTVVKPTGNDRRRARPTEVLVRGNERVTAGGNVKRAKKRVTSVKRMQQD